MHPHPQMQLSNRINNQSPCADRAWDGEGRS